MFFSGDSFRCPNRLAKTEFFKLKRKPFGCHPGSAGFQTGLERVGRVETLQPEDTLSRFGNRHSGSAVGLGGGWSCRTSLQLQRGAQVVLRVGKIRIQFQGLLVLSNRVIKKSFAGQGVAEAAVCSGLGWIELYRRPVFGNRFVKTPFPGEGVSQVKVGPGVVRRESNGFAQVGNGLVQPALPGQGGAQVVLGAMTVTLPAWSGLTGAFVTGMAGRWPGVGRTAAACLAPFANQ